MSITVTGGGDVAINGVTDDFSLFFFSRSAAIDKLL
jgi:hypothetical protein